MFIQYTKNRTFSEVNSTLLEGCVIHCTTRTTVYEVEKDGVVFLARFPPKSLVFYYKKRWYIMGDWVKFVARMDVCEHTFLLVTELPPEISHLTETIYSVSLGKMGEHIYVRSRGVHKGHCYTLQLPKSKMRKRIYFKHTEMIITNKTNNNTHQLVLTGND